MSSKILVIISAILLAFLLGIPVNAHVVSEKEWLNDPHDHGDAKIVFVKAYQFGFAIKAIQDGSKIIVYPEGSEPSVLEVEEGDRIVFRVISGDVTHGFYIDGYTPTAVGDNRIVIEPGKIVEVGPITFNKPGKIKLRCSVTCGPLHPFMVSDIIVKPNIFFYILMASTFTIAGLTLLYTSRAPENRMLGVSLDKDLDLLKVRVIGPILKRFLQWRGAHFTLILPNLLIFMVVLAAGFFGNPTGNKNFSIAVVWILWFAAVEFLILFGSRTWCTICPLPAFGEWIARRRIYSVHNPRKWTSLGKKWPKSLNNMWVSALSFLGISLIVPWLVTRPVVTGLLFALLIAIPLFTHIIFDPQRNFCRSICPANGYIGYHSNASIFAVRSRDKSVCDKHRPKECIRGSPTGYGCPWKIYPGGHNENTYCGQCYECLRSCPLDNMTLKLRMIGQDLAKIAAKAKNKFDEAWMGFIRFTLAVFYELVFFGPYFWIKDWGNMGIIYGANLATIGLLTPSLEGLNNWFKWALIVAGVALVGYPAVFYGFSWLAKKLAGENGISTRQLFLSFSYALVPYGLFLWLAFAFSLILVNWAYPITAFSDPLGWGWNIFGTKFEWNPISPEVLPYLQAPLLLIGLALAINTTYNIARELLNDHAKAFRATLVMGILHTMAGLVFVWIVAG
jgi:polyferredoxin